MSTTLLLTHLQNPNASVPLQTLIAALAHHLVVDLPTPTPLAAAAVSSPFFLVYPPTHERLQGLVTAFRHSVQLKHQALVKKAEEGWSVSRAIFSKGVEGGTREWVKEVLKGLQGGRAAIRLACSVGLLLGLHGLHRVDVNNDKVEDEIIIALAEVMDDYSLETGDWEKEFRPQLDETLLSFTLILASQSLPLISRAKLKALPLSLLASFLTSTISAAFRHGEFLNAVPELSQSGFHIPSDSSFAQTVQTMSTSPTMVAMAGLSKLAATVLAVLINSSAGGLQDSHATLTTFRDIACRIERDWRGTNYAKGEEIAPDTRDLSKATWLLLKTFLFSTIMVADGVLGAVVYARPPSHISTVTPQTLAQSILRTLSHISFVVSQFGGVTATATSDEPGFTELRKVFYLALDVLSFRDPLRKNSIRTSPDNDCENFVKELVADLGHDIFVPVDIKNNAGAFEQAKTAYTLACIEQLVPLLGVSCIQDHVWGLCIPYLSDPTHRETFESAHSVVLSIFASNAQQQQQPDHQPVESGTATESCALDSTRFVHRMVPYYAQCLIENSQDGRLSTAQLRLAYAALVRSAFSSDLQLGWYCISLILDAIRQEPGSPGLDSERLHRLHLTLISTLPSHPLPLMVRTLEEIRILITTHPQSDSGVGIVGDGVEEERKRKELVDALFAEILEKIGDREKEVAMRWWYSHRRSLLRWGDDAALAMKVDDTLTKDQSRSETVSRL